MDDGAGQMLREPVRLDMNEVPYPPPERVVEAARMALGKLNRYADPEELQRLRELLARYAGVPSRYVILSPGSDLLLREMILMFAPGRKVVTVSPSFYPTLQVVEQFASIQLSIRLSPPTFDLNLDVLTSELDEASLVIVDNPNNPTGSVLLDREAVETIVEHSKALVVIDEAYYEFSGVTFADMVGDWPRVAVTRTMDKAFSLAGARIGYAVVGDAFLDAFSTLYAFLARPSLYAAMEALRNCAYMRENVRQVIQERERLRQELDHVHAQHPDGVRAYPSSTNFLLVRTQIPDLARRLGDVGILVADVASQLPPGFIRVSVGTRQENDAFLDSCVKICQTNE